MASHKMACLEVGICDVQQFSTKFIWEQLISGKAFSCFNQKIAGAWVGGGTGFPTNETCEATSLARGFPCYVEERPVVYCTGKYYNDGYYVKVSLVVFKSELKRGFNTSFTIKGKGSWYWRPCKKFGMQ